MKKLLIIVALLVFGAFSAVSAQDPDLQGMFNVSPFAGIGMPMGDMSADYPDPFVPDTLTEFNRSLGIKFGLMAEYFFTSNVGVGVHFMYAMFPDGADDVEGADWTYDDKLNSMLFGVHGKYVFVTTGQFRPYGTLGFGMVMNKVKDWVRDPDATTVETGELKFDSKFYFMGGFGTYYFVTETISIFGEVGFDYMMTDGSSLEFEGTEIPDAEVAANYMFLDLRAGVNFWFGGTE